MKKVSIAIGVATFLILAAYSTRKSETVQEQATETRSTEAVTTATNLHFQDLHANPQVQ